MTGASRLGLPDAETAYLDELVRRMAARLGERLVAVWAFGSAVYGGYVPGRSGLDVHADTADHPSRAELDRTWGSKPDGLAWLDATLGPDRAADPDRVVALVDAELERRSPTA